MAKIRVAIVGAGGIGGAHLKAYSGLTDLCELVGIEAEVRVYGTEGEAVIDYGQPEGLRYRLAGEDSWTQLPFDQPDRFHLQAQHFLDCVATGATPAVTGQDGLAVMRVIDAAYRSAHDAGQPVRLG